MVHVVPPPYYEGISLEVSGPMLADVEHIGFEWEEAEETFSDFIIEKV